MTAPDTDEQLSTEDQEVLEAALAKCVEQQPTLRLFDPDADLEWYGMDGDRHFMSLGGHDVLFDPNLALYTPLDPEPIRLLLVDKLQEIHGANTFDVGGRPGSFDWTTIRILSEGDGQLEATASTLSGRPDVPLRIDLAWQVTVGETGSEAAATPESPQPTAQSPQPTPESPQPTANATQYTGEYLGQYYGSTVFSFEGKGFTLDWTTWAPDRTGPDGVIGSALRATADGAPYEVYAYFNPAVGIQIVRATAAGGSDVAAKTGITASYLGDYYGSTPLAFDGKSFLVDWTTWAPDQSTDDGRVGSPATGLGSDGATYDLYVWFDPKVGAQIAKAVAVEKESAPAAEAAADPRAAFADLADELRERCASAGNKLVDSTGQEFDVSGWVNGEYDHDLMLDGFSGGVYRATLTAWSLDGDPRKLRCVLRIESADRVTVESTDNL